MKSLRSDKRYHTSPPGKVRRPRLRAITVHPGWQLVCVYASLWTRRYARAQFTWRDPIPACILSPWENNAQDRANRPLSNPPASVNYGSAEWYPARDHLERFAFNCSLGTSGRKSETPFPCSFPTSMGVLAKHDPQTKSSHRIIRFPLREELLR